MIGVHDFLADFETHHYTSCVAKNKTASRDWVGAPLRGLAPRQRRVVNSNESVTSAARERQGLGIRAESQNKILVEIATESAARAAKSVRRTFTTKPYTLL
jgi:hypothetical protein